MLTSLICVVCTSVNVDHNSIEDIAGAITLSGATEVERHEGGIIEATMPTHKVGVVELIEGVAYVRSHLTYEAR